MKFLRCLGVNNAAVVAAIEKLSVEIRKKNPASQTSTTTGLKTLE
jgi:hypothetical protein